MESAIFELIRHAELFSNLNEDELKELLNIVELIELHPSQILFQQNDEPDSMYLLLTGDLVASTTMHNGEIKILGYIRPGELVGEMGLISSQPRTLTVSSLNEARLIKLSRAIFQQYFQNRPEALLHILSIVINRAQHTIRSITTIKRCTVIAIIPANENIIVDVLFAELCELLKNNVKVSLVTDKDLHTHSSIDSAKRLFDKLSRSSDYILFKVNLDNEIAKQLIYEKAQRVLVVAEQSEKPKMHDFVKKLINHKEYAYIRKELTLLYDKSVTMPRHTKLWLDKGHFNQHYHIHMHNEDYKYLLRYLVGEPIGLVLSGGGTKGWVHVGALKALYEAQIPIDAVGGTSIGAIVGASYLLHQDYLGLIDDMHEFANFAQSMVNLKDFTYPIISLLDGKKKFIGLYKLFQGIQIEDLWRPFFSISANLSDNVEVVNRLESLWLWTSASSSLPGLVPPITHDGKIYLDGGVVNSLPVDVMKNVLGDKGKIIAVDLSLSLRGNTGYSFPPVITFKDALLYKLKFKKYQKFKFPHFAATLLESLMLGSQAKTERNLMLADIVVRPDLSKYRMISNLPLADELMEIGYRAMSEQLQVIMKDYYSN